MLRQNAIRITFWIDVIIAQWVKEDVEGARDVALLLCIIVKSAEADLERMHRNASLPQFLVPDFVRVEFTRLSFEGGGQAGELEVKGDQVSLTDRLLNERILL